MVANIGDGDLHRAHRDGGWSVAQVISHTGQAVAILRDRDAMPEGS